MLMAQPIKQRPSSAPVITNAYVQNKREDEYLCIKLDSMQSQHYADLIRLRQAVDPIVRLRKNLLTQRAITPQSTLEHVMNDIHAYKKDKRGSVLNKSHLPACTELYINNGTSSKWLPSPFSQSFPSIPHRLHNHGESKILYSVTNGGPLPIMDDTKSKATETEVKMLESSDKRERKPSPLVRLQRKSTSSMDLLTYKELSKIACLESISRRELEREKQQIQMQKNQLNQKLDSALQERVHNFLRKIEEGDSSNVIHADKDHYKNPTRTSNKESFK